MGHNITAIGKSNKQIASLRMQERVGKNSAIYAALNVPHFNRVNSGSGDSKVFTRDELREAANHPNLSNDERVFLESIKTFDKIEIEFA